MDRKNDTATTDLGVKVRWLLAAIADQKAIGIVSVVMLMFVALAKLPFPLITKYYVDNVLVGRTGLSIETLGMALFGIVVIGEVLSLASGIVSARFREFAIGSLQRHIYASILHLPLSVHHRKLPDYLFARLAHDTGQLQSFFAETFVLVVTNVLTFGVGLVAVLAINPRLTLITLPLLPLMVLFVFKRSGGLRRVSAEMQEEVGRFWGETGESLGIVEGIKQYGTEAFHERRFGTSLGRMIDANVRFSILSQLFSGGVSLGNGLMSVCVLYFGGRMVIEGSMTLGGLFAFMEFMSYVFGPVGMLSSLSGRLQTSVVCLNRVYDLCAIPPDPTYGCGPASGDTPAPESEECPAIEWVKLTFSYGRDKNQVHDLSGFCPAGGRIGIVGRTGCGKSTLFKLLKRTHSGYSGTIRIFGRNLDIIPHDELHAIIAVVPQAAFLFQGTIRDNISYGVVGASQTEIEAAATAANIHEDIVKMKNGYDTEVGTAGGTLSGGERARIGLARALLRKPRILLLDEVTSDLDANSERKISESLNSLAGSVSIVLIAHRLSTIVNCDHVYLLSEGRVLASGTHKDLIDKSSEYSEMCRAQAI